MNVVPLDGDGHAAMQALLPWYVSGRLDATEHAEVEAHLAACPRCRAELALERQLQALLAPHEAAPAGGEAGRSLATLRRRIAAETPRQPATHAGWRWWQLALGGQVAVLLLAAALLLLLLRLDGEHYRGQGSAGPAANAIVMFRPETTEAQIRAVLRRNDARLVGGPTATQAWLVLLPVADAQALSRLRSLPEVSLAESLDAQARP